jgi:hypothetical protein
VTLEADELWQQVAERLRSGRGWPLPPDAIVEAIA